MNSNPIAMRKVLSDYQANAQEVVTQVKRAIGHRSPDQYGILGADILAAASRVLRERYPYITHKQIELVLKIERGVFTLEPHNLLTGLALYGALPVDRQDLPNGKTWGYKADGGTFSYDRMSGFCFTPPPQLESLNVMFTLNSV